MELTTFLNKLFYSFKENQVQYAILRNYTTLPFHNTSNDIDILINKGNFQKVIKIIKQFENVYLVDICQRTYVANIYLYNIIDGHKFSLQLDLIYEFSWKGLTFLNVTDVLKNAKDYRSFKVASNYHEAVILFWSKYIFHGHIKEEYVSFLNNTLYFYKEIFLNHYSGIIEHEMLNSGDTEKIISSDKINTIKKKFIYYKLKNETLKVLIKYFKHNVRELHLRYTTKLKYLIIVPEDINIDIIKEKLSDTTSQFIHLNSKRDLINVFRFIFQPVKTASLFILIGNRRLPFIRKQFLFKSNDLMKFINSRIEKTP